MSRKRENISHGKKHAPKWPHNADVTRKPSTKAHNFSDKLPSKTEMKTIVENGNLPNGYRNRVSRDASRRNEIEKPKNLSKSAPQNGIQERSTSGLSNEAKEADLK